MAVPGGRPSFGDRRTRRWQPSRSNRTAPGETKNEEVSTPAKAKGRVPSGTGGVTNVRRSDHLPVEDRRTQMTRMVAEAPSATRLRRGRRTGEELPAHTPKIVLRFDRLIVAHPAARNSRRARVGFLMASRSCPYVDIGHPPYPRMVREWEPGTTLFEKPNVRCGDRRGHMQIRPEPA